MFKAQRFFYPLLLATCAIGLLLVQRGNAQGSNLFPEIRQTGITLAQGLTNADRGTVQGITTPQLWGRMSPSFTNPPPQPGSLGTFTYLDGTPVGAGSPFALVHLHCKQTDGVEDLLLVTLKRVGNKWKVCGGPTAMTEGNPLP